MFGNILDILALKVLDLNLLINLAKVKSTYNKGSCREDLNKL